VLRRRVTYHGFELEKEIEPIDDLPPELVERGRSVLAEALARGEARHVAARDDRVAIEEIRETWRRSGGQTPKLGMDELASIYEQQLREQDVRSYSDFRRARLGIDGDAILARDIRDRYLSLPDTVEIRGREIPVRYDVEETPAGARGVARLTLPEKFARNLSDEELPRLDRPLRFIVMRGARGAARADTLDNLREELERPFTDAELAELDRAAERRRDERSHKREERHTRKAARELRRSRAPSADERRRGPRPSFAESRAKSGRGRGRKRR
jgi:ATP-dependent helicase HrpA